ncbi:DNA-binding IclR family transcriptional regulator [Nocardiopsis terrae]|uniref:DNA-binding IclR family transcriptional regulator n=1 Tax=Nocardiopsis terrae TaxID=372655 RepID=A0ABR9HKH9_9ACTN|nr:IclR family transcriptional regulator [Nocardiopsis terrae]MBE1459526.1 DNA-binding IclR family transcriptional regulator [Nocardiopsis terrae]
MPTTGDSVLSRAMRILRTFNGPDAAGAGPEGGPAPSLTASEISRRAGLPVATAHRLVGELVALGALERGPDKRVRVGYRLWEIASRSSPARGLSRAALPYMEDLQAVVREHTQIGVLEGTDVLYLERLSRPEAGRNVAEVAGRLPVHATSTGLVLLAHEPAEFQERVLGGRLHAATPHTVTDPARLRRLLAGIRRDGFVVSPRTMTPESVGLAAPVRDSDNRVVAALSLVVPFETGDPRRYLPVLVAAARGVSRAMGAPVSRENMIRTQGFRPVRDGTE